jgi:MoxR-like ATPase
MLKLKLAYPSKEDELLILNRMSAIEPNLAIDAVLGPSDLFALREALDQIYVDDKIKRYIVDIIHSTRKPSEYGLDIAPYIQYGASPRATIFLARAAKAQAFLDGRGYVTPQDVKSIGPDVLRHRVTVTYEAEAEDITPETLLQRIFSSLRVP